MGTPGGYRFRRRSFLAGIGGAFGLRILLDNLEASAQGATVYALLSWHGFFAAVAALMGLYAVLRWLAGHAVADRPSTWEVIAVFLVYSAGQGAYFALLPRLFPGS